MYNIYIELNEELDRHDGRIIITGLSTFGNDLQECLENAAMHTEDWHGNETRIEYMLSDMNDERCNRYARYIAEEIATSHENEA